MAPNWTPEQTDAIEASGKAAVVSAAAGSGKTAVLVEKLLRILSDSTKPVSADRIVVVTFTNDAAAQMKQRLCAKLAEAAEADPHNSWLVTQQSLIPSAKISTIHSFCFDLIRQNSALLDVDSGFRVLDGSEADSLAAQAAQNTIDRWFSERSEEIKELIRLFCPDSQNEKSLAELISPLRNKLLALPFPEAFMDGVIKKYHDGAMLLSTICSPDSPAEKAEEAKKSLLSDPLVGYYADTVFRKLKSAYSVHENSLEELIGEYNRVLSEIPSNWCAAGSKPKPEYADTTASAAKLAELIGGLSAELKKTRAALAAMRDDIFIAFSKPSEEFKFPFPRTNSFKVKYIPANSDKPIADKLFADADILAAAKRSQSELKNILSGYAGRYSFEDISGDYLLHEKMCSLLFALIREILLEEKRLKAEKNALTFSDAEQLAVELLCSRDSDGCITKTPLAMELSEYFHIVMIDEFQDSTAVQELIFRMLSKGGGADCPGSNFFAVGDVKQSIYRFRCSDPSLFLNNIKASEDYKKDGNEKRARIYLNRNFRSSHGVVEFVNAVFRSIMSEENGSVDYDKNAELIEGAGIGDIYGPTEIITLPCSEKIGSSARNADNNGTDTAPDSSEDENEDSVSSLDLIEAKCTAVRIRELLDSGKITENGEERPVRPSDICILMRNTKKAGLYISCLEEMGITAQGSAEESYLGSREISILINLLRCIDNVTLDIPLVSVLMSPMFMFTAEDIARLRVNRSSSVYNDIRFAALGSKPVPQKLREQCTDFMKIFGRLRDFAACHTVSELIGFIYSKTDFMAVVSVYSDALKKKANLRLLPVFAEKFGENGSGSLNGFLRAVDLMIGNGKDFQSASATRSISESVEIKTIHKSKGLEYPFVFLCRTHVKFNLRDCSSQAVFASLTNGSGYGVGFRIADAENYSVYESFPRDVLSEMLRKSQRDEEMMLLYVALTRAKCKLFITSRNDNEPMRAGSRSTVGKRRGDLAGLITEKSGAGCIAAVSKAMTMSEWLDIALSLFDKTDNTLTRSDCKVILTEGRLSPEKETGETSPAAAEPCAKRAEILRKNLLSEYDDTLSLTASKLTVSEVAKKHELRPARYFKDDGRKKAPAGISAADRGTAVHAFMQYGDIAKLASISPEEREKAVAAEAERLCSAGRLTEAQAKCADPYIIGKFLDSELCGRILRSDNVMKERKFLVKIDDLCIDEEILDNSGLRVYNNTEGMLQGVADLLFEENDRLILVDYKTDRYVTPQELKARYSMQLYLYSKALSLILGKPVSEAYLYSFDSGLAVRTELSPEAIIL